MYFFLKRVQLSAERVLGLQTLNPDMEQCVSANETESFTLAAAASLSLLRSGCAVRTEAATGFKCLMLRVCVCLRAGNVCLGSVDLIFSFALSHRRAYAT